jgi:hypothetical protein
MKRRRYIALFLFMLFSGLTAGNMAGYVLCKIAVSNETSLRDCGCDTWLTGSNTTGNSEGWVQAASFKSVSADSMPVYLPPFGPEITSIGTGYHASYSMNLPERQGTGIFRPPAVLVL